nr:sugar-binding protein [Oscillochloris sp. ZM17-4]
MLAACGPAAGSGRPTITIAWVHKSLGNPVFELGSRGAQAKARELSAGGPYEVQLITAGPVAADAVEQARVIEDLIARQVDGIAVSCNDPTACVDPINRAVAAGIPVMTWDSDAPDSRRFTYLAIDNYQAGWEAARLLVGAIGPRGKVAMLTGVPGALNLEERARGFRDGLAAYPDVELVATVFSNEDISRGVQGVEEVMQAHPDLRGWFYVGLWPLFADRGSMPLWEAATQAGTLKTVAFDTLPVELNLLREGYLTALIGQKYWGWGYDSVQIVYDRIVHKADYPPFIDTGLDIVTANNVDAMIRAWDTNDFQTPLRRHTTYGTDPPVHWLNQTLRHARRPRPGELQRGPRRGRGHGGAQRRRQVGAGRAAGRPDGPHRRRGADRRAPAALALPCAGARRGGGAAAPRPRRAARHHREHLPRGRAGLAAAPRLAALPRPAAHGSAGPRRAGPA